MIISFSLLFGFSFFLFFCVLTFGSAEFLRSFFLVKPKDIEKASNDEIEKELEIEKRIEQR